MTSYAQQQHERGLLTASQSSSPTFALSDKLYLDVQSGHLLLSVDLLI